MSIKKAYIEHENKALFRKEGDYVLGTVWADGDPQDPWAVGWYVESRVGSGVIKHLIADNHGDLFRTDGFRRVEKISRETGSFLLANKRQIEQSGQSIYKHLQDFQTAIAAEEE